MNYSSYQEQTLTKLKEINLLRDSSVVKALETQPLGRMFRSRFNNFHLHQEVLSLAVKIKV